VKTLNVLVLAGGGIKGAYEVGAVKRLAWVAHAARGGKGVPRSDWRLPWSIYVGISAGALNVARLGGGTYGDIELLENVYLGITERKQILTRPFAWPLRLLTGKHTSLFEPRVAELVERYVDLVRLRQSGNQTIAGAVDLNSSIYRAVTQDDPHFKQWVLASASFPIAFPPVQIEDGYWTDGGVRNVTPFADAIRAAKIEFNRAILAGDPYANVHFDIVIPNPLVSLPEAGPWPLMRFIKRVLGIALDEAAYQDLRYMLQRNRDPHPGDIYAEAFVISPQTALPFSSLEPTKHSGYAMLQQGFKDGANPLPLDQALVQAAAQSGGWIAE
jgi:predicted acylesterase/phospholipase RssA